MMSISQLFSEKLRSDGVAYQNQPAMVLLKKNGGKVEYAWFDYKERVLQVMEGLKGRGLKVGDFVPIIALNLPESFFAILGTILAGMIPIPINVMLLKEAGQKELNKILENCRPALVLGNECLRKLLPDNCISITQIFTEGHEIMESRNRGPNRKITKLEPEPRNPQEILIMSYTSGTSGKPKGVMLSEAGVIDRVAAITNELQVTRQERFLSYLPLGHISELIATFFGQIHSGYTVYFTEHIEELIRDREKFRKVFPKILQQAQPTIFLAVPKVWMNFRKKIEYKLKKIPLFIRGSGPVKSFLVKLIKRQLGFQKTRVFISAGSPIDQSEVDFFKNLDINIDDIYGQTETGGPILINGKKIGDVMVIMLVKKEEKEEQKEIVVQGPCLMLGYYNNPKATAKALEDINNSGKLIYHTGDACKYGKTLSGIPGLICAGRLDNGFKLANGEFISAPKIYELENEIKKVNGVEEVIICGEGKPSLVALIFSDKYYTHGLPCEYFGRKIDQRCQEIGEGLYKIRACWFADKDELEYTATMKIKRKEVIKKFQGVIGTLTNR